MSLTAFTQATWQAAVLDSPCPVLVDVWAPWCVPCRKVGPMVEELGAEFSDRVTVGAVNGDDEPGLMGRYQVLSLPTVLLFAGGEEVARIAGVPKVDKLRALLTTHIEGT